APAEVRELLVFSEQFYGEGMGKVDHGSAGEWQAVFKRIGLDPHAEAAGDASGRELEDLFYLHSLASLFPDLQMGSGILQEIGSLGKLVQVELLQDLPEETDVEESAGKIDLLYEFAGVIGGEQGDIGFDLHNYWRLVSEK